MIHNGAAPKIEIDPETYDVRADGELLVCEPADKLPMAQRYFCFEGAETGWRVHEATMSSRGQSSFAPYNVMRYTLP
jgi:hypothetical protein